jgi:hypothetical protein
MHRGLIALRSALLVLVVGAGIPLAAESAAAGSANPPGQISVTPGTIVEGTAGNNVTFSYVPTTHRLVDGTLTIRVPRGWTLPNVEPGGTPGSVQTNQTNNGKVVIAKRLITVKHVDLCRSCSLALSYSDVSVPATTGTATFSTEVAQQNQPLEALEPAPTIGVVTATPCTEPSTTPGPPSLTVTPGECLSGGTAVSVSGAGFDPKSIGIVEQCNNDPDQPIVLLPAPVNEAAPVSCTGVAIANAVTVSAEGTLAASWKVIAGTTGPPCGRSGDLTSTCPTDSMGNNAFEDAANYPCPPTPAQVEAGVSCTISFGDNGGKQQSVDISFQAAAAPS